MAKLSKKDEISLIADWKTGSYSQQSLADKYNCSKGKVNQVVKGATKAKNEHVVTAQVTLLTAKALLSDEEMTAIMTTAQNEVFNRGLVTNATQLNIIRTTEYLANNKKLEKVAIGGGIQELQEVGLASDDFKQCQDAIDKASVTLGVNARHSSTTINNTNEQQKIELSITRKDR